MAVDMNDMFRRARAAVDGGNYDYAIELFREMLRIEPNHINARVALRGCARKRFDEKGGVGAKIAGVLKGIVPYLRTFLAAGKPNSAIEACEDYLMNDPYNTHVLVKEGRAARKAGHFDLAVLLFEDMRQRNPGYVRALRELGQIHEDDLNEPHKALPYYRQIMQLAPSDSIANKKVKDLEARCHMEDQQITADSSFTDHIKDKDKQKELMEKDSEDYVVRGDDQIDTEVKKLQEKIKEEGDSAPHYMRMAQLFGQKKDYKKQIAAYQKVIEIDPKHFEARAKIGDTKLSIGEQRLEEMRAKLAANPDEGLKAKIEAGEKELAAFAVKEYTWRVDAHPTDLALKTDFGDTLRAAGKIDEAIAEFQKAMEDIRIRTRCRTALGECFMDKNQWKLGLSQFEQIVDTFTFLNDEAKHVHYCIGVCAENLADKEKALHHYEQIYESDIKFRDVAKKIEDLNQ